MSPSTSLNSEVIFNVELPLEEDLVAELEQFIYLGRLGITEEALEMLNDILWQHLQHFPIVAEAVAFLVEHEMWDKLNELVNEIQRSKITLTSADEVQFVETLRTFVKHKAYQPRTDHIATDFALNEFDAENIKEAYTSPAKMQTLELLTIAAFNRPTDSSSPGDYFYILDLCEIVANHLKVLLNRELLWDATRIFSIYCTASRRYDLVLDLYRNLILTLGGADFFSNRKAVSFIDKEKLICGLVANEALLRFLTASDLDESLQADARTLRHILLERSTVLIDKLFHKLHDPPPRGHRVEFWQATAVRLSKTEIRLTGISTIVLPTGDRGTVTGQKEVRKKAEILASLESKAQVSHHLQDQALLDSTLSEPTFQNESDAPQNTPPNRRTSAILSSKIPVKFIAGEPETKPSRIPVQRARVSGEVPTKQKRPKVIGEQDWARVRLDVTRLVYARMDLSPEDIITVLATHHDMQPS